MIISYNFMFESRHDKTNKVSMRPAKTQISLGIRPVWSVFAVRMKKAWVLSYPLSAQRRLWSDWADAHAELSLRWAHSHFVGFVMSGLIWETFQCFLRKRKYKCTWKTIDLRLTMEMYFKMKVRSQSIMAGYLPIILNAYMTNRMR